MSNSSKIIVVTMGDKELTFNVTLDDWNRCVNALQPDNKVSPMHNFLINTANDDATKQSVNQAYQEALTSELFGVVSSEFKPKVSITVKKSKPELSKSSPTV